MPDVRVIKVIDQVNANDLNNLPTKLEVLYVPFLRLDGDYDLNLPVTLNRLYIGPHPSEKIQRLKVPYLCQVIAPDFETSDYYKEFFRIEKLFKEECKQFCNHQILFLKTEDLKRL